MSEGAEGTGHQPSEPTPEQLLQAMRELRVRDIVLPFFTSVAQLGYAKLDPAVRDLEDARLAVETLRALVPVLEGTVPEETVRDFRQVVSNLQLAYASAAAEAAPAAEQGEGEETAPGDG